MSKIAVRSECGQYGFKTLRNAEPKFRGQMFSLVEFYISISIGMDSSDAELKKEIQFRSKLLLVNKNRNNDM